MLGLVNPRASKATNARSGCLVVRPASAQKWAFMNQLNCSYLSKSNQGSWTRKDALFHLCPRKPLHENFSTCDRRPAPHLFLSVTSRNPWRGSAPEDMYFQLQIPPFFPSLLVSFTLTSDKWSLLYAVYWGYLTVYRMPMYQALRSICVYRCSRGSQR